MSIRDSSRTAVGWQTMLADLSLILFMVTAAAMADAPQAARGADAPASPAKLAPPPRPQSQAITDPARAEPLAVWRSQPGSVGLGAWLTAQAPDQRQQLTITARYAPGGIGQAAAAAQALVAEGGTAARRARVILEPAGGNELSASLAYDRPDPEGVR